MTTPSFDTVELGGFAQTMLRFGETFPLQIVVLPALFHEGERTRALAVRTMAALAGRGIGSLLVELQGLGESPQPLANAFGEWRVTVDAAARAAGAHHSLSLRGGALLDGGVPASARYRVAPIGGPALARDLVRAAAVERQEAGEPADNSTIAAVARSAGTRLAGYDLPPTLYADLEAAEPACEAGRTLRLAGDARPADARIAGALLWRQSEPEDATAMAEAIALDFASWLHDRCAR